MILSAMNLQSQPLTIFDTHPSDWRKLGELTIGTNTTKTFDELWDMYLNPDYGDQTTFSSVSQVCYTTTFNSVNEVYSQWDNN